MPYRTITTLALFLLLHDELRKSGLLWMNCISFCENNASVILGEHKGVRVFIKKENHNVVIHGCAYHLIHLAAQCAMKKMTNVNVGNFFFGWCIFLFLKKSTKKIHLLNL
jgi:hypothetical protein